MIEEEKFYTAKYDHVFKCVMLNEANKKLLKEFLEDTLKVKITKILYLKGEKFKDNIHLKVNNLDALLDTNIGRIGIEMNATNAYYNHVRNCAYICDDYSHHFKVGEDYDDITKFLQINFTYGKTLKDKAHYRTYLIQDNDQYKYVENFEIIEYNMDIYEDMWRRQDYDSIKDNAFLVMLNRKLNELEKIANIDERVESFMSEIKKVNQSPEFRQYMTEEEDRQKKYNTEMKIMKEKVKKQAINSGLKQGLKEGLKQGIEQGIEKGIEKGSTETKINAVKNLLLNKVNEDIIMDSLNISKIELENIKKSIR